jgi:hypothetical protein
MDKVQEIIDSLDPASLRVDAGRFAPKLNHEERCQLLACYLKGVNRRLLAVAFGINRRTVTHIYNTNSPHYKDVRKELEMLGRDAFINKYLSEDVANRLKEAENNKRTQVLMQLNDKEEMQLANRLITPNPKRTKDAGLHVIHPDHCEYSHRVRIGWVNGFHGEGWYYKDLDGAFPEEWMHSGKESLLSSTTALAGAEVEVQDKV